LEGFGDVGAERADLTRERGGKRPQRGRVIEVADLNEWPANTLEPTGMGLTANRKDSAPAAERGRSPFCVPPLAFP
jgi:hypothetical protein